MSATATTQTLDQRLNQMILEGKILEAFEEFYDEKVVMQENTEKPREGKAANREYEKQWLASVQEFHGAKLLGSAVGDGVTYSEWEFDVSFKGGSRMKLAQAAARRWKNGKIVHERFYYSKG